MDALMREYCKYFQPEKIKKVIFKIYIKISVDIY